MVVVWNGECFESALFVRADQATQWQCKLHGRKMNKHEMDGKKKFTRMKRGQLLLYLFDMKSES